MKNSDMPAMPIGKMSVDAPKGGDPFGNYSINANGLTKREHFAGLAMQGLLASTLFTVSRTPEYWKKDTIESAIEFADALLAELEK